MSATRHVLPALLCAAALPAQAPLADAAERRDEVGVAALLRARADVNAAQADGMTALHWAIYHDDVETARRLLRAGADARARNRYGVPPLVVACANGSDRAVTLLLESGADPDATVRGGATPLMTAARNGRPGCIRALLAARATVDAKEAHGQTALMWAAAEGHLAVVDALLAAGAGFGEPTPSGFTPLFFAVRAGRGAVTDRLLTAGADVNGAMQIRRRAGRGPAKGTTPLLLAMENGHFELAATLLEAGADPDDAQTGYTPLQALSWIRKPDIGDSAESEPPPRGSGRLTGLQLARRLVAAGAFVDARKADKRGGRRKISTPGTTAFLCAAGTADTAYMQTLLDLGADPRLTDARGRTALMLAAGTGEGPDADGPATPEERLAAVGFLLRLGAELDAVDADGETAMHAAAYGGLPAVVQLLAASGADIRIWNRESRQGRTPLSIARGYRPGNFKPSFETVAAIEAAMRARGVTPPPPPAGKHTRSYK